MSEINNNDLLETIEEEVLDVSAMTVPIDDTLTISGEAADAKAVGDALALKADKSELANAITVNGQSADLQGAILVNGTEIPMSSTDETTLKEAIEGAAERTGEDIPLNSEPDAVSVADAIAAATAQNAQVAGNVLRIDGEITDSSYAIQGVQLGNAPALPVLDAGAVKSVNNILPGPSGNVQVTTVDNARQLQSGNAQLSEDEFIMRTTGGIASIGDGPAWLNVVRGTCAHDGQVEESITAEVTSTEVNPITVEVDAETFKEAAQEAGEYVFEYTETYGEGAWDTNPETFGITVTGTPANGDVITVTWIARDRGTITPATPSRFVSTGWNLFNPVTGYAHVLKYSEEYGFGISGTYTGLQFATTPNGARITITPVGGIFNVPQDGYVFVNGGNTTDTAIWMQWSDWTDSYEGSFAVYTEYAVDLSSVMSEYFPNGLFSVGSVRDEINLNTGEAIVRIERMPYSAENMAAVIVAGRAYDADENYIYAVLETEESYEIDLDGSYTANDHGLELFEDTVEPVYTQALYGENLIDKLRTDVLTKSADLANNLTTTTPGKALDARQGRVLNENLANKFAWNTYLSESNVSVGNTYASTGKSFTLSKPAIVQVVMSYGTGRPLAIGLKGSESAGSGSIAITSVYGNDISDTSGLTVTALLTAGTYYVWARTASASGSTNLTVQGMTIGA